MDRQSYSAANSYHWLNIQWTPNAQCVYVSFLWSNVESSVLSSNLCIMCVFEVPVLCVWIVCWCKAGIHTTTAYIIILDGYIVVLVYTIAQCTHVHTDTNTHTHTQVFVQLYLWGLHIDFHSFAQPNPNPYPNPDINQFMPNPNLNLTSIHTLPINLSFHPKIWCSVAGSKIMSPRKLSEPTLWVKIQVSDPTNIEKQKETNKHTNTHTHKHTV